jgi:hypothetical protein
VTSPASPAAGQSVTFTVQVTGCVTPNTIVPSLYYLVANSAGLTVASSVLTNTVLSSGGTVATGSATLPSGLPAGTYQLYAYGRGTPCFASSYNFTNATPITWVVGSTSTVPGAPTQVTATPSQTTAVLTWTAPTSTGGSAISYYTVSAAPGGDTCTSLTTTCTISNLNYATNYTFSVTATNAVGLSSAGTTTLNLGAQLVASVSPAAGYTTQPVTVTATATGCGLGSTALPTLQYIVTGGATQLTGSFSNVTFDLTGNIATGSVVFAAGQLGVGSYSVQVLGDGSPCFSSSTVFTDSAVVSASVSAPGSQAIAFTSTAPVSATVGTTYTPTALASSGLTVSFSVDASSSTVCTLSAGTVTVIATGTCVIDANQAGNGAFLAATQAQQSFAVVATPQTLTFISTAPSAATVSSTYTPVVTSSAGLTVSLSVATPLVCSISSGVVSAIATGLCTVVASQSGNTVYAAASAISQSFDVALSPQTVSLTPSAITSTINTAVTLSTAATSLLSVSLSTTTPTVCSLSGTTVTLNAVGACVITGSQVGSVAFASASSTIAVTSVPLVGTASFSSTAPLAPTIGVTYAASALVNSSAAVISIGSDSTAGACTVSSGTVTFTGAGLCDVIASSNGATTFNSATMAQQFINVSLIPQTITILSSAPIEAYVGDPYAPVATSSSGLPVTWAVDAIATNYCYLSNGEVYFTNAGPCVLDATQPGNATYAPAQEAVQAFAIGAAPQTISFTTTQPDTAGVGDTYDVAATSSAGLTVSFTVDSTSTGVCTIAGAVVTMTALGTCVVDASQAGTANYFPAVTQSQVIAVNSVSPLLIASSNSNQSGGAASNASSGSAQSGTTGATTGGWTATGPVTTTTTRSPSPIGVYFGANQSFLRVASMMRIAKWILSTKSSVVIITGYWDPKLDRHSTRILGTFRARATMAALQQALRKFTKKHVKFVIVNGGKLASLKPARKNMRATVLMNNPR